MDDPDYQRYHDTEWGVPKKTDQELFEKLVLEGFQAGLSWLTILKKRKNFRTAFDNFNPQKIAVYKKTDITRLMSDPGIIRNKLKIEATIDNAKAYLNLRKQTSLAAFLWSFLDDGPLLNQTRCMGDLPAATPLSKQISQALKAEGFRFVGPTTTYAYMQSVGMVNDHLVTCKRYQICAKLQQRYKPKNVTTI